MKTIAMVNQKGGVGKTTTAYAVGAGLAARGKKVLFVDLDPQGNLSYTLGASDALTVYEVLARQTDAKEAIQKLGGYSLLAAKPALAGADIEITQTGKEYRLKEALTGLRYDYAILDTPPALGILTINALTAANGIIVPAQADIYSLQGIGQLYATIEAVRAYCNPKLAIYGILLTRHSGRTVLARDVTEMIAETAGRLDTKVFNAAIRENVAVKEAQASRQDIFAYAPSSNAALDYAALLDELEV